jgi:hypothetical protein
MTALARGLGVAVAVAATAALVVGSHVSVARAGDVAIVRVAWSARPERIERCRRLSDAEIAALPSHMRRQVECEGTTARYHLDVLRDGVLVDSATVQGGGMRRDREIYVFREITVPPGSQRLVVRLRRMDSTETRDDGDEGARTPTDDSRGSVRDLDDRAGRESDERRRRRAEAIPALLTIDTALTLASRSVILVTYDPLTRRLVTKAAP